MRIYGNHPSYPVLLEAIINEAGVSNEDVVNAVGMSRATFWKRLKQHHIQLMPE